MTTRSIGVVDGFRCDVCQEEYTGIHMEIGMCIPCKRWRAYGKPCGECGSTNIDFRQVIVSELKMEFAELVMLTQDSLHDYEPVVKECVNPLRWANMTNSWMRQKIFELKGIAMNAGLAVPHASAVAAGREVTRVIDGEAWVCLETPNGLTMLHKVDGSPKGDFVCQYCQGTYKVRIAWYNHEKGCKQNPATLRRSTV